jgi:hypothetical protein
LELVGNAQFESGEAADVADEPAETPETSLDLRVERSVLLAWLESTSLPSPVDSSLG